MDDIYQEQILDHYRNPRNFGELSKPSVKAREANASCGDMIEISIELKDNNENRKIKNPSTHSIDSVQANSLQRRAGRVNEEVRIGDIRFKGLGCALSVAAASMLTEKVKGMSLVEVSKISEAEMIDLLEIEVSPTRIKCVQLPLAALRKAMKEGHGDGK